VVDFTSTNYILSDEVLFNEHSIGNDMEGSDYGQYLNIGPPKYETGVLTTWL
jgi:hypothetical protein